MSLLGAGNVTSAEQAEFERRMRELQTQIEDKAPANSQIDPATALLIGQGVPQVSGLTLVSKVGAVVIAWSAVPITDLKRYEVQIATDGAFTTDVVTRFTRETKWTWDEGTAGRIYFFRIRARNIAESVGVYSNVLNGESGEVQTIDVAAAAITTTLIAPNAVNNVATALTEGVIVISDTVNRTSLQSVTLTTTSTNAVLLFAGMLFNSTTAGASIHSPSITDKDDVVLFQRGGDFASGGLVNDFRGDAYFMWEDPTPITGTQTYHMRTIKISGVNIDIKDRMMAVLEIKR